MRTDDHSGRHSGHCMAWQWHRRVCQMNTTIVSDTRRRLRSSDTFTIVVPWHLLSSMWQVVRYCKSSNVERTASFITYVWCVCCTKLAIKDYETLLYNRWTGGQSHSRSLLKAHDWGSGMRPRFSGTLLSGPLCPLWLRPCLLLLLLFIEYQRCADITF